MKKLIEFTKGFLVLLALWCIFSLVASFVQAIGVSSGRISCETQTYIEYVLFTDLFCEVM